MTSGRRWRRRRRMAARGRRGRASRLGGAPPVLSLVERAESAASRRRRRRRRVRVHGPAVAETTRSRSSVQLGSSSLLHFFARKSRRDTSRRSGLNTRAAQSIRSRVVREGGGEPACTRGAATCDRRAHRSCSARRFNTGSTTRAR